MSTETRIDREELWKLYQIAIDEYRYSVQLNGGRMQYYVVLNSGLVAVATGLLSTADSDSVRLLAAGIFFIGLIAAAIGISGIYKSREYYRETVFQKTLCEELLGLHQPIRGIPNEKATLSIGTTQGQKDVEEILAGRPPVPFFKQLWKNKVVSHFMWLLILLLIIDLMAFSYVLSSVFWVDAVSPSEALVVPDANWYPVADN